jgi:hypothetical protein
MKGYGAAAAARSMPRLPPPFVAFATFTAFFYLSNGDKLPFQGESPVSDAEYLVLVRQGDVTREVTSALRDLGMTAEAAGLHRALFVTRANQTVVMAKDANVPIAAALLARGWSAPGLAS